MLNRLPQMPVYPYLPLTIVSGKGSFVYDEAGNAYLDMYGGHAVAVTGHCHPMVVEAIRDQAEKLLFYSNSVELPIRQAFCEALMRMAPPDKKAVFLCNSGAEANENALTVARRITGRKKIVSVTGGFHGRTLLTLSVSGIDKYRALAATADGPLFPYTEVVPFGDLEAARMAIDETCAAMIIEPVQGLGGCVVASSEYLAGLRDTCDKAGAVLIFDEVQCGTGRSGAFTVGQLSGVSPHITTLAKGLAGGFPIGAALYDDKALAAIKTGELGSTFGGGPLACAAGLANLKAIEQEGMIENARLVGDYLMVRLARIPGVEKVQGAGLMIGIVLREKAAAVRDRLLEQHRILTGTSAVPDVLRVLPPLSLTIEQADVFVSGLDSVLSKGVQ